MRPRCLVSVFILSVNCLKPGRVSQVHVGAGAGQSAALAALRARVVRRGPTLDYTLIDVNDTSTM